MSQEEHKNGPRDVRQFYCFCWGGFVHARPKQCNASIVRRHLRVSSLNTTHRWHHNRLFSCGFCGWPWICPASLSFSITSCCAERNRHLISAVPLLENWYCKATNSERHINSPIFLTGGSVPTHQPEERYASR